MQVHCSRQSDKDNLALSREHGSCCLGLDTDSIALIRNKFAFTCIYCSGWKRTFAFCIYFWLTAIRLRYSNLSSIWLAFNHQYNPWFIRHQTRRYIWFLSSSGQGQEQDRLQGGQYIIRGTTEVTIGGSQEVLLIYYESQMIKFSSFIWAWHW